jgi:hypothetical protein
MKKIYFAHCMADYDTEAEQRALLAIRAAFGDPEIVNPNSLELVRDFNLYRAGPRSDDPMSFWRAVVRECDILAYMPILHGPHGPSTALACELAVTAGVGAEILEAVVCGMEVAEVRINLDPHEPVSVRRRARHMPYVLSIAETRAYIDRVKNPPPPPEPTGDHFLRRVFTLRAR